MKKLYMVLLLVCLLLIGGVLAGCGKAADSADSATTAEQNDSLTDNPSVEAVKTAIQQINTITEIAIVTEDNDPNNQLGKQGGYTGCLYFTDKNAPQIEGGDVIKNGTKGGGSIEIYANSKDAKKRDDYLATFDGSPLASGSHTVVGTLVVRTSSEFTASQQKALESQIVDVLNGVVGEMSDEDVTKPTEPIQQYVDKTYSGISFKMDSSWGEETYDDGNYALYPSIINVVGGIIFTSTNISENVVPNRDYNAFLDISLDSYVEAYSNVNEISRTYYEIGGNKAARIMIECDNTGDFDIADETRLVHDVVMIISGTKLNYIGSIFGKNAYDDIYKDAVNTTLGSINISSEEMNDIAESTKTISSGSIRPEFKAALDSYEAFFDEYIEFMTSYKDGKMGADGITKYTDFMTQYADTMQKMGDLQSEDLTDEELAYYLEVTTRISTKLLSVSGQ